MLTELGRQQPEKTGARPRALRPRSVGKMLTAEPCCRGLDGQYLGQGTTPGERSRTRHWCGVRGGGGVMRKVSLIAAGLLAFGLTAARAEVGTTNSGGTA